MSFSAFNSCRAMSSAETLTHTHIRTHIHTATAKHNLNYIPLQFPADKALNEIDSFLSRENHFKIVRSS